METVPTDRELEALSLPCGGRARPPCGKSTTRSTKAAPRWPIPPCSASSRSWNKKGLAGHRKAGKAYLYFAKIEGEATFRTLAAGFLLRVFDGAMDEYLVHALQSRRLSLDELDRLESMIAEAKTRSKGRREKR